jgi:prepilin-type N-terminal cleavage/methylation domain-containing protein
LYAVTPVAARGSLGICALHHVLEIKDKGGDTRMKQQSGFTLVELAVVVLLIGMIATMGISALNAQLANAAISATKKKQDTIKDALIAYLGKYKRLPCPAIDITVTPLSFSATPPATVIYTLTDASAIPMAPNTINGPTVGWLFGAYQNLQTKCP